MELSHWERCAAVLLVLLKVALSLPCCPMPCLCEGGLSVNCSSVGLSLANVRIPASVTTLDLSHNALPSLNPLQPLLPNLTHLYLGHNLLAHLSLCWRQPTLRSGNGLCATWAPRLELLSAERNQLQHVPQGVGGALQVLNLSHNRISSLQPQDLQACTHLRELHLQHNRISTLLHLALRELPELQILDLRFNALSTLTVPAYLSLWNLNTQVELSGNPWRCDCGLRAVRRWMGVAADGPQPPWQLECSGPARVAGRNLLHLDDDDLTCDTPIGGAESQQEVTVQQGVALLLPCGASDSELSQVYWWTPNGSIQLASTGLGGGLLIHDVSEQDTGLYLCTTGTTNQEPAAAFTVRIRRGVAGAEPAPDWLSQAERRRTQSELALAVCLSVFLTFIAAFILGALARPLLDTLWGRVRAWRRPPVPPKATPYDNQGFSEQEGHEEEEEGTQRDPNMPYYITVLPESDGSHTQGNDSGLELPGDSKSIPSKKRTAPQPAPRRSQPTLKGEVLEADHTSDCSRGGDQSESSMEGSPHPIRTMEFEPIPDPQDLEMAANHSTAAMEQSKHRLSTIHDLNHDLEQKPTRLSVSSEEFAASKPDTTMPPGDSPFPVSDWADSRWEPHPSGVWDAAPQDKAPPLGGVLSDRASDPGSDPELWNDSGESFRFTDSPMGGSARASGRSLSLAQQLKDSPWSPFHQSEAAEQHPNEDHPGPEEAEFPTNPIKGEPLEVLGGSRSERGSTSSSESSQEPTEHSMNPENTALNLENITLNSHSTGPGVDPFTAAPPTAWVICTDQPTENTSSDWAGFDPPAPWPVEFGQASTEQESTSDSDSSQEPTEYRVNPEISDSSQETTEYRMNPEISNSSPETTEYRVKLEISDSSQEPTEYRVNPESPTLQPDITALNAEHPSLNPEDETLNPKSIEPGVGPFPLPHPGRAGGASWVTCTEQHMITTGPDWGRCDPTVPWPPQEGGAALGEMDSTPLQPPPPPPTEQALEMGYPLESGYPLKPRRSLRQGTPLMNATLGQEAAGQEVWPVVAAGDMDPPPQAQPKQDWRRGGVFFQRKRAMDKFTTASPPPQSSPTQHLCGSVTMETSHSQRTSTWLSQGEDGDAGVAGENDHNPVANERLRITMETLTMETSHTQSTSTWLGHTGVASDSESESDPTTSDPTSFVFSSCRDEGSEA
ncbi:hypothetical protein JZ751_019920 [Albula glossodonta]|uniref:Ig-like domain-containing protein n=1 Tax=Albula glossodonta TaxID=121402 RepID=A0A8T2N3Q4_9TELE|nr:hypothetical protein JZ751_019920 [Albula glossodonta]